jgi:hypothetical protein
MHVLAEQECEEAPWPSHHGAYYRGVGRPCGLRRASADAPRKAMDFAIILSFCAIG